MIDISVCLETVFTTAPVIERLRLISEAGFRFVEFWHPEGTFDGREVRFDQPKNIIAMREECRRLDLAINDFALHAWDGSIGGSPVRKEDRDAYLTQIRHMIECAKKLGCQNGITLSGKIVPNASRSEMRSNLENALAGAIAIAQASDFTLLLEPLNTLVDHPGYYLGSFREAVEIVKTANSPHLKLLYDVYHMQIMEGNVIRTIERNIDLIGHFHAAGVPGRGELFGGELDFREILRRIEACGYQGCFGLEYFPRLADHRESLRKICDYVGQVPTQRELAG